MHGSKDVHVPFLASSSRSSPRKCEVDLGKGERKRERERERDKGKGREGGRERKRKIGERERNKDCGVREVNRGLPCRVKVSTHFLLAEDSELSTQRTMSNSPAKKYSLLTNCSL